MEVPVTLYSILDSGSASVPERAVGGRGRGPSRDGNANKTVWAKNDHVDHIRHEFLVTAERREPDTIRIECLMQAAQLRQAARNRGSGAYIARSRLLVRSCNVFRQRTDLRLLDGCNALRWCKS